MKRILFLLLLTVSVYGQNPSRFAKIQITGNSNSGTATKVNVQEANGEVNTQTINTGFNKNFGLNSGDVVGATTLLNQYSTTPIDWTATAFNSGQVVFYAGKQWIAKIATVAGDVPAVSSKWEEITFEALSNKTTTVDQTIIDGSTNAVSGNAVFDGLALKSNIGHTHVASQITDLSKASVGLGNVDNTSDLSKPLSTATQTALNGKENSFTKNTAFNKNFGTTAGTVVEGGTLGSNAYNSTAYLPLTGGTLSGYLNLNDGIGLALGSESTSRLRFITSNGVNYIQSGTGSGYGTRADLVITGNYGGNETVRFKADGTTIFSNSPIAPPATTANQVPTWGQVQAIVKPYKVYTALLTQIGYAAPTATVLENTLGGSVSFSRVSTGIYRISLTGAFTLNKTGFSYTRGITNNALNVTNGIRRVDNDTIEFNSVVNGSFFDGQAVDDTIEIRVYL